MGMVDALSPAPEPLNEPVTTVTPALSTRALSVKAPAADGLSPKLILPPPADVNRRNSQDCTAMPYTSGYKRTLSPTTVEKSSRPCNRSAGAFDPLNRATSLAAPSP